MKIINTQVIFLLKNWKKLLYIDTLDSINGEKKSLEDEGYEAFDFGINKTKKSVDIVLENEEPCNSHCHSQKKSNLNHKCLKAKSKKNNEISNFTEMEGLSENKNTKNYDHSHSNQEIEYYDKKKKHSHKCKSHSGLEHNHHQEEDNKEHISHNNHSERKN